MSGYGESGYENRGYAGGAARDGSSGEMTMTGGSWATLLCGMAAGAALMYFFDPERGGARRALLRDKMVGMTSDLGEAAAGAARDLSSRAQGLVAEAGSALGVTGGGGAGEGEPAAEEKPRHRAATA